jgi:hypothetical protein
LFGGTRPLNVAMTTERNSLRNFHNHSQSQTIRKIVTG